MRFFVVLILIFLLGGCATIRESYAPDGRKAYTLNCSGLARGWDKCLASAGEMCGLAGYDILDRNSEDKATASADRSGFFAAKTKERTMLIACRKGAQPVSKNPKKSITPAPVPNPPAYQPPRPALRV